MNGISIKIIFFIGVLVACNSARKIRFALSYRSPNIAPWTTQGKKYSFTNGEVRAFIRGTLSQFDKIKKIHKAEIAEPNQRPHKINLAKESFFFVDQIPEESVFNEVIKNQNQINFKELLNKTTDNLLQKRGQQFYRDIQTRKPMKQTEGKSYMKRNFKMQELGSLDSQEFQNIRLLLQPKIIEEEAENEFPQILSGPNFGASRDPDCDLNPVFSSTNPSELINNKFEHPLSEKIIIVGDDHADYLRKRRPFISNQQFNGNKQQYEGLNLGIQKFISAEDIIKFTKTRSAPTQLKTEMKKETIEVRIKENKVKKILGKRLKREKDAVPKLQPKKQIIEKQAKKLAIDSQQISRDKQKIADTQKKAQGFKQPQPMSKELLKQQLLAMSERYVDGVKLFHFDLPFKEEKIDRSNKKQRMRQASEPASAKQRRFDKLLAKQRKITTETQKQIEETKNSKDDYTGKKSNLIKIPTKKQKVESKEELKQEIGPNIRDIQKMPVKFEKVNGEKMKEYEQLRDHQDIINGLKNKTPPIIQARNLQHVEEQQEIKNFIDDKIKHFYDEHKHSGYKVCTCDSCQFLEYPILIKDSRKPEEYANLHKAYLTTLKQNSDQVSSAEEPAPKISNVKVFYF